MNILLKNDKKMRIIKIANKLIGGKNKVFIIAELSANHNHDYDLAVKTLETMKKSGADAVKLQTYTAETMTINSNRNYFKIRQNLPWDGLYLYNLYKKAYMPWEWQPKLQQIANKLGLIFFSSAFDMSSVDFLEKIKIPVHKIASYEITDIPLIKYIASKNKPVILSTGIATLEDIKLALKTIRDEGNNKIILLKCTSAYPTPLTEVNLNIIGDMKKRFNILVGLSDHTPGATVPIAATAMGVKVIEKHFILDRKLGGPDSAFSMEPEEFKYMVKCVRDTETALGSTNYKLSGKVKIGRKLSRSLFVVNNIKEGEKFTSLNIRSIRPYNGLPPKFYNQIIGKKAAKNIKTGTPLSWTLVSK